MKCCCIWTTILPKRGWSLNFSLELCLESCLWPLEKTCQELCGKWGSQPDQVPPFPTEQFMLCTKCTGQEAPAELIWGSHREKDRESAALNPGLGNCHSPGGSSSKRLLAKELPGAEGDPRALPGCRINWSHPILESCSHPSLGTPKDQENFKIKHTPDRVSLVWTNWTFLLPVQGSTYLEYLTYLTNKPTDCLGNILPEKKESVESSTLPWWLF